MPLQADRLHPRPQMSRARWVDLGGCWHFAYDDQGYGLDQGWHEREDPFTLTIRVPFPPESAASGVGDTSFHPVVWYRRMFTDVRDAGSERLLLHCGAVDYRAHVWVDGQLVITHEGGHTPFSADITAALKSQEQHVLVIRAEDLPSDLTQPRGKQDWQEQPHDIWYHRTTGIWQPVWLEPVAATYIEEVRWTPDLDREVLRLDVALHPDAVGTRVVRAQVRCHDTCLVEVRSVTDELNVRFDLTPRQFGSSWMHEDLLWAPEHPTLLDATITIELDGWEIDRVDSYVGLRSIGIADGRFMLNGKPYYLRFVLEQGYWPESHLAAPSPGALRREVEIIRDLGFNGARIHQKIEDPRFLYWCDRLGLLVWGEMPNATVFSPTSALRLTREWTEVVRRDFSHPCIVAWVPLNESWGVPDLPRDPAQRAFVQALYFLTKALDPTRPVIANDGWEFLVGDIVTIHDYAVAGATLQARYGDADALKRTLRDTMMNDKVLLLSGSRAAGQPVMLTEFGGVSQQPALGDAWFGYGTVATREDFLVRFRELVMAVVDCPPLAGFCYTQLTDTLQETNGLLTEYRIPKLDPAAIRGIVGTLAAEWPDSR